MQIVINVDNKLYEYFSKRRSMHDDGYFSHVGKLIKALRNGTPLPKGHGNLFDENDFEKRIAIMTESMDLGYGEIMDIIDEIPTIIEADKVS